MIEISVKADVEKAIRFLDDAQRRQVPFAASRAINATASDVKLAMRGEMSRSLDRPKAYTLGGLFVAPSNKRNLVATVGLIDKPKAGNRAPEKYLAPQIEGGSRRVKAFESALLKAGAMPAGYRVVPGAGAKIDRYGNISAAQMQEIFGAIKSNISNLRIFAGRGKRAHAVGYFVVAPGNPRTAHLAPGLYRRNERGGASTIVPVLLYVQGVSYRKRLDLMRPAETVVRQKFSAHFEREIAQALATAR